MTTSAAQSQLWLWFLRTTTSQTLLDISLAPGCLNLPPSIYSEKAGFFGVDGDWIFSAPVALCETAVNLRHFLEFLCCQPVALSSLAFTPKSRRISEWMGSPIFKAPRLFKKVSPMTPGARATPSLRHHMRHHNASTQIHRHGCKSKFQTPKFAANFCTVSWMFSSGKCAKPIKYSPKRELTT